MSNMLLVDEELRFAVGRDIDVIVEPRKNNGPTRGLLNRWRRVWGAVPCHFCRPDVWWVFPFAPQRLICRHDGRHGQLI